MSLERTRAQQNLWRSRVSSGGALAMTLAGVSAITTTAGHAIVHAILSSTRRDRPAVSNLDRQVGHGRLQMPSFCDLLGLPLGYGQSTRREQVWRVSLLQPSIMRWAYLGSIICASRGDLLAVFLRRLVRGCILVRCQCSRRPDGLRLMVCVARFRLGIL